MAKLELFSTWLDVIQLVPGLWDKSTVSFAVVNKSQILQAIKGVDNEIKSQLRNVYSTLLTTPWYKPPISDGENDNNESYISPILTIEKFAITEVLTLKFITPVAPAVNAFTVTGDISGVLTAGSTANDYIIANVITIPKEAWIGTFEIGDQFYISLFASDPLINNISSRLAAAEILDSIMTAQVPNSTDVIEKYRSYANDRIEQLKDKQAYLLADPITINLDPESVPYNIDSLGHDITEYAE